MDYRKNGPKNKYISLKSTLVEIKYYHLKVKFKTTG